MKDDKSIRSHRRLLRLLCVPVIYSPVFIFAAFPDRFGHQGFFAEHILGTILIGFWSSLALSYALLALAKWLFGVNR
ncbi:MAG: hypothetical protein ACTHM6_13000 [Tepidisphaeraceae bacterium]